MALVAVEGHPVAYESRKLNGAERPYAVHEKERGEDQPENWIRKDRKLAILGNLSDRQVTQNLSREGRLVRPPAKEKETSQPLKRKKGS